jgi:hypothetical protein
MNLVNLVNPVDMNAIVILEVRERESKALTSQLHSKQLSQIARPFCP